MNKKGFTLIELLIVVAVIGILASVVLVGLGPIQKQGRDARRISDLRQIQNGLELYYNKNGAYPQQSWGAFQASTLTGANIGVSNVPSDPTAGRSYYYESANGTTYCLGAQLEDLNNPNWRRSVNCNSSCFNGSGSGNPTTGQYYCVSL
ncbi:MAG: type II secretion system GspH family protein [Patescibacteria group bacterium]|nr:type II secretion system GspH family protein [Patescibacteria group bacterium]MDW8279737.1 type II secretion system protein [bacterium]